LVEKAPPVESVHRDFLLLRDYTALSLLFLVALGIVASFAVRPATVLMGYLGFLVLHSRWFAWRPRTAASGLSPRCWNAVSAGVDIVSEFVCALSIHW
jgi:hypothetical protein